MVLMVLMALLMALNLAKVSPFAHEFGWNSITFEAFATQINALERARHTL